MLGAIIGDIAGSRYEWNNIKSKDFELLNSIECFFTDDTVMTLAIAKSLIDSKNNYDELSEKAIINMVEIGRKYPNCGFGGNFYNWIMTDNHSPYNSYGNGAAMRVSACGIVGKTIEEVKMLSKKVTAVSHNHPEGIKGAEAVACAVYLANQGNNILDIRDYIQKNYYDLNFKLDDIRKNYNFDVSCQGSVPQALEAFFESVSFEDALRNAISIGGDSDTIAAIVGGIAGAYYGIPSEIRKKAITFLDQDLLKILIDFEKKYPPKIEVINSNQNSVSYNRNIETNSTLETREEMLEAENELIDFEDNERLSENEKISSQQLYYHLYEACNILRGPINQDEYKSYVIPLLFFKRLCDVYDEETQIALEESGGDEEYAAFEEQHSFIIPSGSHWDDIRNITENVGKAIVDAMVNVERSNFQTLNGLFSSFDDANWSDKTKLSDERLKNLVEHMSKIKVGNNNYSADVMGDAYERLLKKFADLSKKNAGEFYTPRSIVKLMVDILDPKPGESVYDPACGTGGMLIEAIKHMKNDNKCYGRIFGQENNLSTSAIARMNLFLHGARDFKIMQGDTLRNPLFIENNKLKQFNCVIANPPFSLKNWGADQFASDIYGRNIWGTPSNSNGDFAWLQHMISSMDKNNGRCAVVLPQGVLFHKGKEKEIRKSIIKSNLIEAVISLPSGIFYSTTVTACILILSNTKKNNDILFVNAENIYTSKRAQNVMTEKDIEKIFKYYVQRKNVVDYAAVVGNEDIEKCHYDLSVSNYIETSTIKKESSNLIIDRLKNNYKSLIMENKELEELLLKGGYIDGQ